MIVTAYGGGTNSTAMLIGMKDRGIMPDLIIFSDTGAEKPKTYEHLTVVNNWLLTNGMPQITVVSKDFKDGKKRTIYEYCLERKELPSIAYGFKTCSDKFKTGPLTKYCNNYEPLKKFWATGEKAKRFIGIDADEHHRAKGTPEKDQKKWDFEYPLLEWDWGRDECIQAIKKEGLPLPGKSSCFMCPSNTKGEIRLLEQENPELLEMALKLEANADLKTINGLGRRLNWADYLSTPDMFGGFDLDEEMPCGCFDGGTA